MTTVLYPYKQGSNSAKELSKALGIRQLKVEGSLFKGSKEKTVINWGASQIDNKEVLSSNVVNSPEAVALVSNKLNFFNYLSGLKQYVPRPSHFTTEAEARDALEDGLTLVARTKLNGHSGEGIVILTREDEFVKAPLYTNYLKKKSEFRVHFMNGRIFHIQQKVRRADCPDDKVNWMVRNHENGFNYAFNDIKVPEAVYLTAEKMIANFTLDFGAIDIIYNEREDCAYVLEVNSAPGLTGETLVKYTEAFMTHYVGKENKLTIKDVVQKGRVANVQFFNEMPAPVLPNPLPQWAEPVRNNNFRAPVLADFIDRVSRRTDWVAFADALAKFKRGEPWL